MDFGALYEAATTMYKSGSYAEALVAYDKAYGSWTVTAAGLCTLCATGDDLSASITDSNGNTSELSASVGVP